MASDARSPVRTRLVWLGEFVFVLDALLVGLLAAVLIIAGVGPFSSPGLTVAIVAGVVILAAHHVWYVRHRFEVDHDRARLAARERRGF